METLTKQLGTANAKYLVFTSAGDNSNLMLWQVGTKAFDLWVCYYGDQQSKFSEFADYYLPRKGGKFPNLHACYQQWHEIFSQYEAIIVMDDDLVISATEISRLFEIRQQHNLWLLQPAFDRRGKISFKLNEVQAFSRLRYTNFTEVTCPLFLREKLDQFMAIYDPILIGWGVDIWFSQILAAEDAGNNKIAIIDEVSCVNPRDRTKHNQLREIDKRQGTNMRQKVWQEVQYKYQLDTEFKRKQYSQVKSYRTPKLWWPSLRIIALKTAYKAYKFVSRDYWQPS